MPDPLPRPWVDKIFQSITLRYGVGFMNRYAGLDIEDVKGEWCRALSGFQDNPKAIAYALDHLGDSSPNATQFRDLCRLAPSPRFDALPAPELVDSPASRAAAAAIARTAADSPADGLAWAKKLRAREEAGEKLTAFQREKWRLAIGGNS